MQKPEQIGKIDTFLRTLVLPLLDFPEYFEVNYSMSEVSLRVARQDTGKIIGEGGRVFRALRLLLAYYTDKIGVSLRLMPIEEPVYFPTVKPQNIMCMPGELKALLWDIADCVCADTTIIAIGESEFEVQIRTNLNTEVLNALETISNTIAIAKMGYWNVKVIWKPKSKSEKCTFQK